jgi:hypothetical protein
MSSRIPAVWQRQNTGVVGMPGCQLKTGSWPQADHIGWALQVDVTVTVKVLLDHAGGHELRHTHIAPA